MPTLLAPLGLLALGALALPLLVHLIRRSERKPVDFAALRWLDPRSRPRRHLRLHDRVLLALRLMLIAALAVLLAAPVWRLHGTAGTAWVLVSPDVDPAMARAAIDAPAADWRWLAPGFPSIDTPAPVSGLPASLIREADAILPPATRLDVVVPQTLAGMDAERLRLGRGVAWHPVPGRSAPLPVPASLPELRVAVRGGPAARDEERTVVRALVKAWQADGRKATLDETMDAPIPADTTLLFWLGGEPPATAQDWIVQGGRVVASSIPIPIPIPIPMPSGVVSMTAADGTPLLHDATHGGGHIFAFANALTPTALPAVLDPEFPRQLLMQVEPAAQAVATATALSVTPRHGAAAFPGPYRPLDRWVGVFVAMLFLLERWWATRRRSTAA